MKVFWGFMRSEIDTHTIGAEILRANNLFVS